MSGTHLLQIKRRAEKLEFSTALLATLAGVSTTGLANYLRGVGTLNEKNEEMLGEKLRRLEKIFDALAPLQMPQEVLLLNELVSCEVPAEEISEFVKRLFPWHRPE